VGFLVRLPHRPARVIEESRCSIARRKYARSERSTGPGIGSALHTSVPSGARSVRTQNGGKAAMVRASASASSRARGAAVERTRVADFTGDGRADVAVHDRRSGHWWVGRSTGSGLAIEPWAVRFGNRGLFVERIVAGP
jgi:hypothetical protein